jgi:hypothetical protein
VPGGPDLPIRGFVANTGSLFYRNTHLLNKYNFFIFEVLKASVATSPKYPRTVHYRGDGVFMVSGKEVSYKRRFKPENL